MKQWTLRVLITWSLAVMAIFVLGAIVPAWPSWLELPWSGFDDFAATADGKILVYSSVFSRLLVYDSEGDFVVSLPGLRSGGSHALAVDRRGRVYVAVRSALCTLDLAGAAEPACQTAQNDHFTGWQLNQDGTPEAIGHEIRPEDIPNRPVGPGEILLSPSLPARRMFAVDGPEKMEIRRTGDRLSIRLPGRPPVRLSTPWYLYWAKIPFPGFLAWIATFLAVLLGERGKRKRTPRSNGDDAESPLARTPKAKKQPSAVTPGGRGGERVGWPSF
jgi:hypothetical protein